MNTRKSVLQTKGIYISLLISLAISLPVRAYIGEIGDLSDARTTTTQKSIFLGFESGINNSNGSNNTALGYGAQNSNSSGNHNTAVGTESLFSNITGSANTALGSMSLFYNIEGNDNVALGDSSMFNNISGRTNTAVGYRSLHANQTGSDNVAVGDKALASNEASNNIAIGSGAGSNITTGSFNIIIGDHLDAVNGTASNQLIIGDTIFGNTSTHSVSIGIPNLNPDYKLDVDGIINAKGFTIDGQVFSGASNLASVQEIFVNKVRAKTLKASSVCVKGATKTKQLMLDGHDVGSLLFGPTHSGNQTNSTIEITNATVPSIVQLFQIANKNLGVGISALHNVRNIPKDTDMKHALGRFNLAVGHHSLSSMNIDNDSKNNSNNTAIGAFAGQYLNKGEGNIFIGKRAGKGLYRGSHNIFIGTTSVSQVFSSVENLFDSIDYNLNIGNAIFGNLQTGNIGIGVLAPTAKLEVAGGIKSLSLSTNSINVAQGTSLTVNSPMKTNKVLVSSDQSGPLIVDYTNSSTSGFAYTAFRRLGVDKWLVSSSPNLDNFVLGTPATSAVVISKAGKVGIGLTPPASTTAALQVKGKTMTDVLSLPLRTSKPSATGAGAIPGYVATPGDVYAFQSGTNVALCMYIGTAWVKVGGNTAITAAPTCPL